MIPKNKDELLSEINIHYKKLKDEIWKIDAKNASLKELDGQVAWDVISVCNLLAYLIWWWELVLKWEKWVSNGVNVDFPETGYKWNELGKLAQKFYIDYEDLDFEALQEKLDEVVNNITLMIDSKTNYELYESLWYTKWTLWRMIQFNTSSPYKNVRARLVKWRKWGNV